VSALLLVDVVATGFLKSTAFVPRLTKSVVVCGVGQHGQLSLSRIQNGLKIREGPACNRAGTTARDHRARCRHQLCVSSNDLLERSFCGSLPQMSDSATHHCLPPDQPNVALRLRSPSRNIRRHPAGKQLANDQTQTLIQLMMSSSQQLVRVVNVDIPE
jgi:hypothetical protein